MERITLAQALKRMFAADNKVFTRDEWSALGQSEREQLRPLLEAELGVKIIGPGGDEDE